MGDQSDHRPPTKENKELHPKQEEEMLNETDSLEDDEELRKRQRQSSPQPTSRFSYSPTASPHKHATFEELLAAADHIQKLSLAHDLVTKDNFKLSPQKLPENSVHKLVRDMMHKAFWDILSEQLESDPPVFDQAITLLKEVRESLISLLLPRHEQLKKQITDVIDLDLVRQQAEHNALDVFKFSEYVISVMAKLCAPVRDEEIDKLRAVEGVVPLYKEIFRVLDLMKIDMANHALDSIKPHLKQQSVEYERSKFEEFLKVKPDGLESTQRWLAEAKSYLSPLPVPSATSTNTDQPETTIPDKDGARPNQVPDSSVSQTEQDAIKTSQDETDKMKMEPDQARANPTGYAISPILLLNQAYMSLFEWSQQRQQPYPETMLTDQSQLLEMSQHLDKACLLASVLLVTYTNVGPVLTGIQGFPSKLKYGISVVVGETRDFSTVMPNIAEQACSEVVTCLKEHGLPVMENSRLEGLKTQVIALGDSGHPIRKLIDSRAKEFLLTSISCPPGTDLPSKLPASLKTLQRQMMEIATLFSRLVRHNRAVYGPYYSQLIASMLRLPR